MSNLNICYYGKSGTHKTTQIGFIARYIYEKTGKPMRLVSADGGGWRPILPEVEAGLIEPYSIRNEPNPTFILHKIVEGWWPTEIKDGLRVGKQLSQTSIEGIGGYAFEGVTTISELMIDHLAGKKLGMNPAYSLTMSSSGETISSSEKGDLKDKKFDSGEKLIDDKGKELSNVVSGAYSQDHYGYVQKTVIEKMVMSWDLPVELVVWTAHEAQGEDEMDRTTVRGPALVGKKGTPKIGRNVGMLIHCEPTMVEKIIKKNNVDIKMEVAEVRYHFMAHPDKIVSKITWEAKPRIPSTLMPELLKVYPNGFFVPSYTEGLDRYLRVEDDLLEKGSNDAKDFRAKIDSLKLAIMEKEKKDLLNATNSLSEKKET